MRRSAPARGPAIAGLVVAALSLGPGRAAAQTVTAPPVQPSVSATTFFDSNVLSLPAATADIVLRVTPGLALGRVTPRVRWSTSYSFDAERYQDRTDLTTIQARQALQADGAVSLGARTSIAWSGGYTSTTNPGELNTLTGLNVARVRANQWLGSATINRDLSPHVDFSVRYSYQRSALPSAGLTESHGVDVRVGYRGTPHSESYVHVDTQRFDFGANGAPSLVTAVAGGWEIRPRFATITAEAGAQVSQGSVGPRVSLAITRTIGQATLTGSYMRSVTTALGVPGTVAFDTVQAGFSHQAVGHSARGGLRVGVHASASRNAVLAAELRSWQYGGDLTHPLAGGLSLQVSYDTWVQESTLGAVGLLGGHITRQRVFFTVTFSPWSVR